MVRGALLSYSILTDLSFSSNLHSEILASQFLLLLVTFLLVSELGKSSVRSLLFTKKSFKGLSFIDGEFA